VDVKQNWGGATLSWAGPGDHIFNASVLTSKDLDRASVAFGAEAEYSKKNPLKINVATSYVTPTLVATLLGKFKIGRTEDTILGLNVYNRVASSFVETFVGAEGLYSFNGKDTTLAIGASTKPDPYSTLKGRITTKGVVGFAYTQAFNSPLNVTFLVDLDLNKLSQPRAVQYGLKFVLS